MVLDGGLTLFNFIITEVCNWNCDYCAFPQIQLTANHTTKEIIDKHIDYINEIIDKINPDVISVQGGEIGLIPEDILEYFFARLNRKIDVSTNGEFLKRGFHKNPIIKSKVRIIMLHVVDKIDNYKVDINYDSEIPVVCGIVDINKNPEKVKQFIQANSQIYFEYIDYEHSISEESSHIDSCYLELFYAIRDLKNVSKSAIHRILKKHELNKDKVIKLNQNVCMRLHPYIYVDLVNERIPLCIRNFSDVYQDLTYDTLIKIITNIGFFNYKDNHCNCCFRMCQDDGIDIKQILKKSKLKGKF